MKQKIAYINPQYFIDTDLTVLKYLKEKFDILWIPIISKNNPSYCADELKGYAAKNNIQIVIFESALTCIFHAHPKMSLYEGSCSPNRFK